MKPGGLRAKSANPPYMCPDKQNQTPSNLPLYMTKKLLSFPRRQETISDVAQCPIQHGSPPSRGRQNREFSIFCHVQSKFTSIHSRNHDFHISLAFCAKGPKESLYEY